jgi:hypothetical protein
LPEFDVHLPHRRHHISGAHRTSCQRAHDATGQLHLDQDEPGPFIAAGVHFPEPDQQIAERFNCLVLVEERRADEERQQGPP